MDLVHTPTFRLNSVLVVVFVAASVVLWIYMPERYPTHFDLSGTPTTWSDRNPGIWILVTSLCLISFGQGHLFQRFLINDPDSALLNVPHKERFLQLPRERKVRVIRRLNRLLGIMNLSVLVISFTVMLMMFTAAHAPSGLPSTLVRQALNASIIAVLVYPIVEVFLVRRMIRQKLEEEGLL